jgi:diaminopimelate decarboxylase
MTARANGGDDGPFPLQNGILHAEDVAIPEIAAAVGTPFYVYSTATLTRHYHLFTEALSPLPHLVCFAIKSLSNVAVLKTLGNLGAGMDVVSGGEYMRAKAAGVPGERIVFSGVGKTRDEMRLALTGGIRQFNVESEPEMRALSEVADLTWCDRPDHHARQPGRRRQDP